MDAVFTITVRVNNKRFRMQVYEIYKGDSLERFKIVGGKRYIILQSNRPMLEREKARKPIAWKLLEGDITTGDPKQIAEALNEIIRVLEYKIKEQPPSQLEYIRRKR